MQDLQDGINASNKKLLPAVGKAQRQLFFGVVNKEGLAKERGGAALKALRLCRVRATCALQLLRFRYLSTPEQATKLYGLQYNNGDLMGVNPIIVSRAAK